jgi:hypothetical protein
MSTKLIALAVGYGDQFVSPLLDEISQAERVLRASEKLRVVRRVTARIQYGYYLHG